MGTVEVRPPNILGYEVAVTHFVECYVINLVGFDVAHVCIKGRPAFRK